MLRKKRLPLIRSGVLFAVSALVSASTLGGAPASWVPLGALLRNADAVAAVTVTNVSEAGSSLIVAGTVLRTIKGSLRPGTSSLISAAGALASPTTPSLVGRTCLWFLRQAGSAW